MPKHQKTAFSVAATAMLNCRKLLFWSRDLYLHGILHFRSKFCINRPIWCRDIAKRFSIWRPAAILNLQTFDFLSKISSWCKYPHQHTKFDRNPIIRWRHHIASENCILCSQLCVKFSRRSVAYFLKYLVSHHVFHVSAFWLEITYFRLNLTIFSEK